MITDLYVYLTDILVHKEVYINSLLTVQQWYYMYMYLIIYTITSTSVSFSYVASNKRELKDNPDIKCIFDGFCCQFFDQRTLSFHSVHIAWYFCISWSINSLSIKVWMINDERMFGTSKNNSLTAIEPKANQPRQVCKMISTLAMLC